MKRTNQFERTDRDITNAFLNLLQEKPFEKITIQDIIAEALINRSTFYQHFSDKYAILESLQYKYMNELTDVVAEVFSHDRISLTQIDQIMETYFLKNRRILLVLLNIKTEHVNMAKQLRDLFTDYFLRSFDTITNLEAYLISGLWVDFFTYYLEHDEMNGSYSSLFFESYYKLSLIFFQIDKNPEAQTAFRELIHTYAGKHA